jgi:hypothetical protein
MLVAGCVLFAGLTFRQVLAQKSQTIALMCTVERTLRDYTTALDRARENGTLLHNAAAFQQLQQFTDKRRRIKMNVNGKSVWVEPSKLATSADDYPGWYRREEFQAARERLAVLFRQAAKYPDMVAAAQKQFARDTSYGAWREIIDPIRKQIDSRQDTTPIQFATSGGWSALIQCGESPSTSGPWTSGANRVLVWDLSGKSPSGKWHTAIHELPTAIQARSPSDAPVVFVIETRGSQSAGAYVPQGQTHTYPGDWRGSPASRETITIGVYDSSDGTYFGTVWLNSARLPTQISRPSGSHAPVESRVTDSDIRDFIRKFFEFRDDQKGKARLPASEDGQVDPDTESANKQIHGTSLPRRP